MPEDLIRVREVMQSTVETIDGMATVREAVEAMSEQGVSSLVVARRHDADEFGVVSIENVANWVLAENRSADRISVYEIMDKPMMTISPDMAVKYAIRLLARFSQRRALVMENRQMCGIVTMRTLVTAYLDSEKTK